MPTVQKATVGSPLSPSIIWAPSSSDRNKRHACSARPTLLWIDDFEPGLALYKKMFEDVGFNVLTASSGETGVVLAASNQVDVVVTDYEMPGMDGMAVAKSVKALSPTTPVLLFSGSTLVPFCARRFVDAFCDKAGSRDKLLASIHSLLQRKRTRRLQPAAAASASNHGHKTVA